MKSSYFNSQRLTARFLLPVILATFAGPFLTLLRFATPAIDDFCKASLSIAKVYQPIAMEPQRNAFVVTWFYYTNWSPRWLTTFTQSVVMSHVDLLTSYGWLLFAVILLNVAALTYFLQSAFSMGRLRSLLGACVFYAAWIASVGNLHEHLYWLTGAIEYDLSLSSTLVLIGLLLKGPVLRRSIIIAILSLAIPAQHEIAGTFLCMALAGGIALRWYAKLPNGQWFLSLSLAVLSYAVVMLAPGNAIRAAQQGRHLWDFRDALHSGLQSFLHDGPDWLISPPVLAGACCFVVLASVGGWTNSMLGSGRTITPIACGLGMLGVLAESALIKVAIGSALPSLVVSWLQFPFWLLFFCLILTGVPELLHVRFSWSTEVGAYALLAAALLGSTNFRWAKADLGGTAQASRQQYVARLRQHGGSLVYSGPRISDQAIS